MNEDERKRLAEQILTNPLFELVFSELETDAIDQCIETRDPVTRADKAAEVRVIREFRRKCKSALTIARTRNHSIA